jgi:hypothetical protein
MARKRLLILAVLTLVALAAIPALGQEDSTSVRRWAPPKLLSDGWWQSITIDQMGSIHIGLYGGKEHDTKGVNYDFMSYISMDKDGHWSDLNDVIYTGTGGYTVRNALATTSDGMIYAVFRNGTAHMFSGAPIAGASNATNWSKKTLIDTFGYYVNMTSDRNDGLHIVYSGQAEFAEAQATGENNREANPCALCGDLFYRRSTNKGKTWSDPYPLSLEPMSGSDRPDIFQGQSGRLYIDWDEGYDWYVGRGTPQDVRIAYSNDNGLNWSQPIILDGGNLPTRRPIQLALTEMRDDVLMAVWRYSTDDDRSIYFQTSADLGKTWTKPTAIPYIVARSINETPLDDYELLTDRLGIVHLFAVGQQDVKSARNATLFHIQYSQGTWQTPDRIMYSSEMRPEWPKAVIGPKNDIHVTWFTRGIAEGARNIQDTTKSLKVFYSYLPGNLSALPPVAFKPTETLTPTATIFQKLDPTLTPLPTIGAVDANLSRKTTDMFAQETLLGGMFLAGAFCLVVALIMRYLSRR